MKKQAIILLSSIASILLGIGLFAVGFALSSVGATIAMFVVGGLMIVAGSIVGLPYAFIDNDDEYVSPKANIGKGEAKVEKFENKKHKQEEKVVVKEVEKQEPAKQPESREL